MFHATFNGASKRFIGVSKDVLKIYFHEVLGGVLRTKIGSLKKKANGADQVFLLPNG